MGVVPASLEQIVELERRAGRLPAWTRPRRLTWPGDPSDRLWPQNALTSVVQSKPASGTASNSPSVTLDSTPTAGNMLVVCFAWISVGAAISITPDSNLNSAFAQIVDNSNTSCRTFAKYRVMGAGETKTYAATLSSAVTDWAVHAIEFSGVHTTVPLDKSASNTGTTTTVDSGTTATTTEAAELWLAFLANRGGVSQSSPTNSFSLILGPTTAVDITLETYTKEVAATGAANAAATIASNPWNGQIGTFKLMRRQVENVVGQAVPRAATR